MRKKHREYKCSHCGWAGMRFSDKQWIKSYCDCAQRWVHLTLVKPTKKRKAATAA